MKISYLHAAAFSGLLAASGVAMADTPSTLEGPHGHGQNATGLITKFRVQEQGMEIGQGDQALDAEVLVTLDTQPDMVYGLRLHGSSPATEEMIETLRQAYIKGVPVTLQHPTTPGKQHVKISFVELSK